MLSGKKILENVDKIIKEKPEIFEALLEFERTGKLPKLEYKERANFTINSKILKRFREYCKKQGYSMSKLIENFMKKHIEN